MNLVKPILYILFVSLVCVAIYVNIVRAGTVDYFKKHPEERFFSREVPQGQLIYDRQTGDTYLKTNTGVARLRN